MSHISPEALAVVGSLLAPPVAVSQETPRQLKRKSTKEGKSYSWYTSLGGVGKGALPLGERTKLLATLDGTITVLRLNNKDHFWVDAILFLTTQQSPTLRVRSVSIDPELFREQFRKEFQRLKSTGKLVGDVHTLIAKFDSDCVTSGAGQLVWLEAVAKGMRYVEAGAGGVVAYPNKLLTGYRMPCECNPDAPVMERPPLQVAVSTGGMSPEPEDCRLFGRASSGLQNAAASSPAAAAISPRATFQPSESNSAGSATPCRDGFSSHTDGTMASLSPMDELRRQVEEAQLRKVLEEARRETAEARFQASQRVAQSLELERQALETQVKIVQARKDLERAKADAEPEKKAVVDEAEEDEEEDDEAAALAEAVRAREEAENKQD